MGPKGGGDPGARPSHGEDLHGHQGLSCEASPSPRAPATSCRPLPLCLWRGTPWKASSTSVTSPRAQKAPRPPPEQRGSRPLTTPAGYVHPCQHLLYAPGPGKPTAPHLA